MQIALHKFSPNKLRTVLREVVKYINVSTGTKVTTPDRPLHTVGIASKITQEQFRRMMRIKSKPKPQLSQSGPRLPVANSSFGIRQLQWSDEKPPKSRKQRNDQIRLLLYTLHQLSVCFLFFHQYIIIVFV